MKGGATTATRRVFLGAAAAAGWAASARGSEPRHYDVIVVGLGSAGCSAAWTAARRGLDVLALEIADEIGGTAVRAGVSMWEPGVGGTGVPFDLYRRLKPIPKAVAVYSFGRHMGEQGYKAWPGGEHVVDPDRAYADTLLRHRPEGYPSGWAFKRAHMHGVVFEPAAYARVVRDALAETGRCELQTQTTFKHVDCGEGRVRGLTLTDGRAVTADAYIDATGGGALCKACGCAYMRGREAQSRFGEPSAPKEANDDVNGVTLIFRITPVDAPRVEPLPEGIPAACWWRTSFPVISAVQYPNGDYNCNMLPTMEGREYLRLGPEAAYAECKRRVYAQWRHLQTGWPELQHYRLESIRPALGVRESTRIVGEYVLTENDLRQGLARQDAPDLIAIADHPMDMHGAHGGLGPVEQPYGVPFRCLVPKGFTNLLIACRGASFSALAASSCRLNRTMLQLGQAAGTAASVAKEAGVSIAAAPPEAVRAALRDQHVQLEFPLPAPLRAYIGKA